MSFDLDRPLQTNTFGFNIPCREFVISAQVTRDRRMPLVDEFILRALNIVEAISVTKLSRYFGFEGTDLGIALADLQARSLVSVTGEEVSLHSSAKELFRTATDSSQPTIAAVEAFHARVWFDLISQGMIAFKGLHNARNLLALKAASSKVDFGAEFARQAFDANFRDYLRNFRNIRNADLWSLYAILDVQPGRYSYAQITSSEQLVWGPMPKLEPLLWPEDTDRTVRIRHLTEAMVQELRNLSTAQPSAGAREEYARLVGSNTIQECIRSDGYIDLPRWLKRENQSSDDSTMLFVGYPYIERNRRQLGSLLARLSPPKGLLPQGALDMAWLRPAGSNWGVSEDLGDTLAEIRAVVRRWSAEGTFGSTLIALPSVPVKSMATFDRLFDQGVHCATGRFAGGLEILTMPGVFAVVAVAVPVAPEISIPIGCMTVDPKMVANINQRAQLERVTVEGTALWKQKRHRKAATTATQ